MTPAACPSIAMKMAVAPSRRGAELLRAWGARDVTLALPGFDPAELLPGDAARHIVSVNVRISGGDDSQLVARGDLVVAIDIAFGIEHDGIARARAADQVGILCE